MTDLREKKLNPEKVILGAVASLILESGSLLIDLARDAESRDNQEEADEVRKVLNRVYEAESEIFNLLKKRGYR